MATEPSRSLDAAEIAQTPQADVSPGWQMAGLEQDHEIGAAGEWPRGGIAGQQGQRVRCRGWREERIAVESRDH